MPSHSYKHPGKMPLGSRWDPIALSRSSGALTTHNKQFIGLLGKPMREVFVICPN